MSSGEIQDFANEKAETLIEELKGKYPTLVFDNIVVYMNKKLHHELTLEIENLVKGKELEDKDKFRLFYSCLYPLMKKLKKTIYAELLYLVSRSVDANWTINYIKESEAVLENDKEGLIMFQCILVLKYTELSQFKSCEEVIEKTKKMLQGVIGLSVFVHKFYNFTLMNYYKALNMSDLYVKYALLFLAYTPLDDLEDSEKMEIGKYICIHSIISEDVYNIGEIIQLPLISVCLQKTPEIAWLYQLILVYNEGKMDFFFEVVKKYEADIKNTILKDYEKNMLKKMTLLALMDLAFRKKKQRSEISFVEIAEHCKIDVDDVEKLLITARSKNILTCKIDEIEKAVKISWVKPRVLSRDKIFFMKESIDKWIAHSKSLLTYMEELSVELLVS